MPKFYMLGNPVVWWTSGACVVFLTVLSACYAVQKQRQLIHVVPEWRKHYTSATSVALGGWVLHWLPFFLMGRVMYLHHYYPTLIFACLCTGVAFDHVLPSSRPRIKWAISILLIAIYAATFVYFAPLAYGMEGPSYNYKGRVWLKSWNLIDPKPN